MILLDYGGTLLREPDLDFRRGWRALLRHAARNPLGRTADELCAFDAAHFRALAPARRAGFEIHEHQMLRYTCDMNRVRLDLSWDEAEDVLWDAACPMGEECLLPGAREALAFLEREGVRTGVVSNIAWSGRALKRRLDALLPGNRFEFIIASSEYGVRKPDRRLFDLALSLADLPAARVWFIGDTFPTDVLGAAGAGVWPVLFGSSPAEAIFPYSRIGGWAELPALLNASQSCEKR